MIEVDQLCLQAGDFQLREVTFAVPEGGYAVLMGPTGTGKTTLMEAIAGLNSPSSGTVRLAGEDVTHLRPSLRGVGYVPQDGALFRTMSVAEHLGFALEVRGMPSQQRHRRIDELAELLCIRHLLQRLPAGLSGGERQRVALGRALSFRPRILLLDEPLSALDAETRRGMYDLLRSIRAHSPVTVLHVTHNLHEARELGDTWFYLRDGRVEPLNGDGLAAVESAGTTSLPVPTTSTA